jgi:hypothetical protein
VLLSANNCETAVGRPMAVSLPAVRTHFLRRWVNGVIKESVLKIILPVLCGLLSLAGCRTSAVPNPDEAGCRPFAQVSPVGTRAMVPLRGLVVPTGAAIVGYVADSGSDRGVIGALVMLVRAEPDIKDSVWAYSDSTGGFQLESLKPGRYQISVRSPNFHLMRNSIDLSTGVDTVRVAISRAVALCRVTIE